LLDEAGDERNPLAGIYLLPPFVVDIRAVILGIVVSR